MNAVAENAAVPIIDAETIKLTVLETDQALNYWEYIVPHIEKVFALSAGRINAESTKQAVKDGMAMVLLVWNPETGLIFAVMLAEGRHYPNRKVFSIGMCGGSHLNVWAEKMWPALQSVARQKGFDQIEVTGRRGWGHFIPGAEEIATFYAMDLDTEEGN